MGPEYDSSQTGKLTTEWIPAMMENRFSRPGSAPHMPSWVTSGAGTQCEADALPVLFLRSAWGLTRPSGDRASGPLSGHSAPPEITATLSDGRAWGPGMPSGTLHLTRSSGSLFGGAFGTDYTLHALSPAVAKAGDRRVAINLSLGGSSLLAR